MKRKSNLLTWLRLDIYRAASSENDPELKQRFSKWHKAAKGAETEIDEMMRDAEMHGIRNPAFPDDFIGWLDDDFSDRPQLLKHQKQQDDKGEEDKKDEDKGEADGDKQT